MATTLQSWLQNVFLYSIYTQYPHNISLNQHPTMLLISMEGFWVSNHFAPYIYTLKDFSSNNKKPESPIEKDTMFTPDDIYT